MSAPHSPATELLLSGRQDARSIRRFFAGFLVMIGVFDVVETLLVRHPLSDRLVESVVPTGVVLTGKTATVVAGLALILLARGILRGKRVAWLITCLVLAASLVIHLLKGLDLEAAVLSLWVLVGLWWMRRFFRSESDPVGIRRGLLTIGAAVALSAIYAFLGSLLLERELSGGFQPGLTLNHLTGTVLAGLANAYDPLTDRARWFLDSIPAVAGFLLLVGIFQLLRPVVLRARAERDEDALRQLLEAHGHNPVSWLAQWGTQLFWPEPGVAVAYEVTRRVAIALGDPIGPAERAGRAVAAFAGHCERHDWVCAFYEAENPDLYRPLGYRLLPVGSDAVIHPAGFDLAGKEKADLRYAVRRCEREGVRFEFLPGPEAWERHSDQLWAVSASWLRSGKGPEMRFSLGTLDTLQDPATTAGLAFAAGGELLGFVTWLPVPAREGWTLDLMRRRPDAPNGLVEALVVHSLEEAARAGRAEVSLGVAPLSLSGFPSSTSGSLLRHVYGRLDRFRSGRSLTRFKAKFAPDWEARYLAVPETVVLPEVLAALLAAHLPPPLRLLAELGRSVPAFSRIGRRYWPV
jgi:phosphatidylglycerol lysyltransferase